MKRTILSVVSQLLFAVGCLVAQPSCRTSVPVIAIDQKTNMLTDSLTVSDFRAELNGSEVRISNLTSPPPTRRIVFVIDRSGSMFATKRGIIADQALSEALSATPNVDSVAFLEFFGKCAARTPFLPTRLAKAKLADIHGSTPQGKCDNKTPLWDNIEIALQMLNSHLPGDTIIVISDGGENESKLSESKLRSELLVAGVQVFAIVVPDPYAVSPVERLGPIFLQDLIETTGGTFAVIEETTQGPQDRQLAQVAELISMLAHQYHLTLDLPDFKKRKSGKLNLSALDARKHTRLLYPRYLYPCAYVQ